MLSLYLLTYLLSLLNIIIFFSLRSILQKYRYEIIRCGIRPIRIEQKRDREGENRKGIENAHIKRLEKDLN